MQYALILDENNIGIGVHTYAEAPISYPKNEMPCSVEQAKTPSFWQLVGGVLVEYLPAVKAAQIAALSAACAASITGGYTSSALGSAHQYGSAPTDQLNMAASVLASLLPGLALTWTTPFKCQPVGGAWALLPHTAAQIQQAGSDGKAWVLACQTRFAALAAQIENASSATEASAVAWLAP